MTPATEPVSQPVTSATDDGFVHIVGQIQYWLDRFGVKVPRALCGLSMEGEDDPRIDWAARPTCPACAARAGWQG